jgi:hypothetical protein
VVVRSVRGGGKLFSFASFFGRTRNARTHTQNTRARAHAPTHTHTHTHTHNTHTYPPTHSVHIITDYGRPTGVVLVEFASPQEAQMAMTKDKQMMGTRYIEVFLSSRDELQRYLPRSY